MDTAKAAMIYHRYPAEFTDYFGPPVGAGRPVPGPLLPHIACPTTSGTGSECTSVSVIRLTEHNCKFVVGSPYLVPVEAIVDPACTDTLPSNVIASTGFDLLCHANKIGETFGNTIAEAMIHEKPVISIEGTKG